MKKLYESGENYLEAIMMIKKQKGVVYAIDVANWLGFSKPSVSRAMKNLFTSEYITYGDKQSILFTKKGEKEAKAVLERHNIISSFLTQILKIDEETADKDACKIEHIISEKTFEAIKKQLQK